MKKNIILFIIVINSLIIFGQQLTQEEKQRIIDSLDSYNIREDFNSRILIEEHNIVEAIPKLESKAQNGDCTGIYLRLLQKLGSTNVQNLAHLTIDASYKCYDPVETRYDCSKILIELGDYSTAQYIIDYYNAKASKFFFDITLLPKIIDNRPDLAQQAKPIIFDYAQNFRGSGFTRYIANGIIAGKYSTEAAPILVNSFRNEPDNATRILSLWYLFVINYPELPSLMKERLLMEEESAYRRIIADSLLKQFGTVENYLFVKGYLANEQDTIVKLLVTNELERFTPTPPNMDQTISNLIDSLILITDQAFIYYWLGDIDFSNELKNILTSAKTNLQNGDSLACRVQVKAFQDLVDNVYKDSLNPDARFVTIEGWKFLYWNAQYILDRLPEPPANPNLVVSLKSSTGTLLTTGSLQYYEGSWKDAVNNGDGTFTVITNQNNVSLRMTYEYAQQTVNNIPAHNNTYTFQTVSANMQLRNSQGLPIDTGTVQYYAGAWRSFGTTTNGVATKELLPINYSFRMTYEYASIDKQQNLSVDPIVVFQTVNAQVQLKNSLGNFQDVGTVQYYAGAWRTFGTTTNGIAAKELLPINYSFRMTYEFASRDKQQNLSVDPVVVFQTVNAQVQLKNSLGNLIDVGTVQYYAGAWRSFGTTINGIATKELLPINYSFRMTHEFLSKDKQQNLSTNPVVEFQTVLCTVKVNHSDNQPFNNATVQYYGGAWKDFGVTNTEGITTKELLPQNISFRASYGNVSLDKQQDIGVNSLVEILLNVP